MRNAIVFIDVKSIKFSLPKRKFTVAQRIFHNIEINERESILTRTFTKCTLMQSPALINSCVYVGMALARMCETVEIVVESKIFAQIKQEF